MERRGGREGKLFIALSRVAGRRRGLRGSKFFCPFLFLGKGGERKASVAPLS